MIIGYLQDILIGRYINGHKIVKVEYDKFIKGQINLITEDWEVEPPCNDRTLIIYRLRDKNEGGK